MMKKLTSSDKNSDSPPEYEKTQDNTKTDPIVQWARQQYELCKSQRAQQQKAWEYNLLQYGGDQWRRLISGKIETPKAPSWRSKLVTNKIRPAVRQQITRMTNQKPSVSILPVSTSEDDLFAAQAGEAVWDSLYSRKRFHQLYMRCAFWVAVTGNGFFKTYWDANKIDKSFLAVSPMLQKPMAVKGDIEFGVVTPFNLFAPDLLVEDIEDQPFLIEAYTRPVEWVNTFWKDKLQYPVSADCVSASEIFNTAYWSTKNDGSAVPDAVLVLEVWLKPGAHKDYPNGAMLTIIGQQLIQKTDGLPYSHGEYPIAHWGDIMTGKFYRESMVTDLAPLNQQYNRTRAQMIESMIRTGRTQIMYTEGSLDPNRVTSRPGELIPIKPGYQMPVPLPAQPIPQFVTDELRILSQDFEDISGQHAVSKGQTQGGVIAATAINYLQEQDDTMNYPVYASGEAVVEKVGRQSLSIVADMWDIPRIIRTIGTDRSFDVIELKGAQIANGLDLRVEAGSSLSKSKTARQAFLMDLAKMQFISPEQLLDLIDMGGTKKLTEVLRTDMYAAQRENLKMKKLDPLTIEQADAMYQMAMQPDASGYVDPNTIDPSTGQTLQRPCMVPVNEWDDHQVHIDVHNRFRKSQEFEFLPDIVKREFQNHILLHQVQLIMNTQRSMMMQQGGPPPGMMDPNMAGPPSPEMLMGGEAVPAPGMSEGGMQNGNDPNLQPGGPGPSGGQA